MKIFKYVLLQLSLLGILVFSSVSLAATYESADQAIIAAREAAATNPQKALELAFSSGFSKEVMLSFANDEPTNPTIAMAIGASSQVLAQLLASANSGYTAFLVKIFPDLAKDSKIAAILNDNPNPTTTVAGIDTTLLATLLPDGTDPAVLVGAFSTIPAAAGPVQNVAGGEGGSISNPPAPPTGDQGQAVSAGQTGPASAS